MMDKDVKVCELLMGRDVVSELMDMVATRESDWLTVLEVLGRGLKSFESVES